MTDQATGRISQRYSKSEQNISHIKRVSRHVGQRAHHPSRWCEHPLGVNQIFRYPLRYAISQAHFSLKLHLPTLPDAKETTAKLASPWPDLTIGLRQAQFKDYRVVLRDLGAIVAPIACVREIIFSCLTVEVIGESGQAEAESRNMNNAAHLLRNLRLLSWRANGEGKT